jgi:AcrR family transcriptional regulator
VEGVAARAGVAKTTIYRRWRSKEDLALAVLIDMAERMMPVPDLGDTRGELVELVRATIGMLTATLMGRVMQGLVSDLAANPELAKAFQQQVVATRRAEAGRVIERGLARGDLRPDADFELVPELLVGPVYYRLLLSHAPLGRRFAERVVDAVLPVFAADSATRPRRTQPYRAPDPSPPAGRASG